MAAANMRMRRMRLSKGSQVEVQRWDGESSFSWRCAEVVSGNGHYYVVRIHGATSQAAELERVPRKFIRPPPVPVGLRAPYSWSTGDEVEAFVDHAWWPAVVTAVGCGKVVAYLHGKMKKVRVRACELRLRRQWVDNQWTLVHTEPREAIISGGFPAAAESCNVAGWQSRIFEEEDEVQDSGYCSSVGSCDHELGRRQFPMDFRRRLTHATLSGEESWRKTGRAREIGGVLRDSGYSSSVIN